MNQTQNIPAEYLSKELALLGKKLFYLSDILNPVKPKKNLPSLKGLLRGVKITDKEIEQVKKQLYSSVKI